MILGAVYAANIVHAQDLQLEDGAVGSYLRTKELQTRGSVLHVVAHPDDEDGATLAYCARGLGVRTMLFSITRGEGGANLISSHFFDDLGALRTLEHLKAASYYGVELFYSRAADYGYSKTLKEAMTQWNQGTPILEDLVEVIRRERPTVILSRFAGNARDGHGHHQMAGVISRLAFDAAADPNQFPEQIQRGFQPWQVKKLYVQTRLRENDWTVVLPTGTFDPVIGRSYAQIARFGLGFQRSQGISGHSGDPGPRDSYYRLVKQSKEGDLPEREETLFDGVDTSLPSIIDGVAPLQDSKALLESIDAELRKLHGNGILSSRAHAVTTLAKQLAALRSIQTHDAKLASGVWRDLDHVERKIQDAIIVLSGLDLSVWVTSANGSEVNHAVSGETMQLHIRLANQGELAIQADQVVVMQAEEQRIVDESHSTDIPAGEIHQMKIEAWQITAPPTRPHWFRTSISQPMYTIQPNSHQRPLPPAPFQVVLPVVIAGQRIELATVVETRIRHPEFGLVQYPLTVAPALSVGFSSDAGIIPRSQSQYKLPVVVRSSRKAPTSAVVKLDLPDGWSSTPSQAVVEFAREGDEATVLFEVNIPDRLSTQSYALTAFAESEGDRFSSGFKTVTARDLGRVNIFKDAAHTVQIVDVELLGTPRVGYIAGSGDDVASSLAPLGVTPVMLTSADLASGDLSELDVVVVGCRAYAVREDIRAHNARLLQYVHNGGVLIVQYQTPEFDHNFGPYPYQMGAYPEEVSQEDSDVTILEIGHPLVNSPNKITAQDFEGWFEQRGSKFWTTWDDRYTSLFECHDTDQSPQQGGMLVARHGKGLYIYSAYAWYRQLPNGVPGAYRIFANMLSSPETMLDD
ncbi:MAG: PIG-L family deacetylase [Pirellulaceae bacterium]